MSYYKFRWSFGSIGIRVSAFFIPLLVLSAHSQITDTASVLVTSAGVSDKLFIPLEFRGYYTFADITSFSLRDAETNRSWWVRLGQERAGVRVDAFDRSEKTITISWNGRIQRITLYEFENSSEMASWEGFTLSPINQKVYSLSEKLIKATPSNESGRLVWDHRKIKELRTFIAGNPSVSALHDFVPKLGDAVDYEEFLKIEFPEVMKGRNAQNTPRWGINRSLDIADIEQLIASKPSQAELDKALHQP
jgi:hypothetical protein